METFCLAPTVTPGLRTSVDRFCNLNGGRQLQEGNASQAEQTAAHAPLRETHLRGTRRLNTPVVETSYYVVSAFNDGELAMDEAILAGPMQIRLDETSHVAALFSEALSVEQAAR